MCPIHMIHVGFGSGRATGVMGFDVWGSTDTNDIRGSCDIASRSNTHLLYFSHYESPVASAFFPPPPLESAPPPASGLRSGLRSGAPYGASYSASHAKMDDESPSPNRQLQKGASIPSTPSIQRVEQRVTQRVKQQRPRHFAFTAGGE
jgi:hypothetical protein